MSHLLNHFRTWSQSKKRIAIRQLSARHRQAMTQHLLALAPEDRYLRFGYAATDEHISAHVETLNFQHVTAFGVFNRSLKLVGLAQISFTFDRQCQRCAEFGVSVLPECRGRSLGRALFERAATHARNEGVARFLVHALTQNRPMLHIAKSAGASVHSEGDESQVIIVLPPADFDSQVGEVWHNGLAKAGYKLQKIWRRMRSTKPSPEA